MIYLERPSAQSCATCTHLTTASHLPRAVVQGIPPEHLYCPILGRDLEPFRGRRATMVRCASHRSRFADWPSELPDSRGPEYGQFISPGATD